MKKRKSKSRKRSVIKKTPASSCKVALFQDNRGKECRYYGVETIAADLGISLAAATRAVADLEAEGFIEIEH